MAKRICIVCGYACRDLVKPFGILTEAVAAHHHHTDEQIRRAWLTQAARKQLAEENPRMLP
jgi:hypothetical protein